jgi:predicted metalloprotease
VSTRPSLPPIFKWRWYALVLCCTLATSACAIDAGVTTLGAAPAPALEVETSGTVPELTDPFTPASTPATVPEDPANTQPVPGGPGNPDPGNPDPGSQNPSNTVPGTTLPPILEPELYAELPLGDVVNAGEAKPARDHDAFVAVALADIERWLTSEFPTVFGKEFEPLEGGIYAGYPERTDDIPGCGEPTTSYDELTQFAAFYCQFGDFMAYDDGDNSILVQLSEAFGPAVLGIVLAHEYGHAVQSRIGAFDDPLPTVFTEQQADCFAGAWAGRAYRGESDLLRLGDRDLRTGLIAMVEVRDPVGFNQLEDGGHGSAFDRVGAFQEGFVNGLAVCATLLDDPLTLMPNVFQPASLDEALGGNAAYDCSELPTQFQEDCTDAPVFLSDDLNNFWATIDPSFEPLTPVAVTDFSTFSCPNQVKISQEVVYCPDTSAVAYDEPAILELYRDYGDFTLGYFFGIAWADVAQTRADSPLTGEPRALLNDCLTGAWVLDITPDDTGAINRPDSGISASPGDLDEAIQMAILVGDVGANVNIIGSPFEKIASFRSGVIGGLDRCDAIFDLTP